MNAVTKLIVAVKLAQQDHSIMERQLRRMQDRTRSGVDIHGVAFAPFKRLPKDGRQTPLGRGGLLIARARVGSVNSLDGTALRATITGQAAKIAYYQNRRRQFWGFSQQDKLDVVADFKFAMKGGRR